MIFLQASQFIFNFFRLITRLQFVYIQLHELLLRNQEDQFLLGINQIFDVSHLSATFCFYLLLNEHFGFFLPLYQLYSLFLVRVHLG
jgi:hypothetical protein